MLAPVWEHFPCLVPTMRSRVDVVMCCFSACTIPDREIHAEAPSWFLRAEKADRCLRTKPPPRCAVLKGLLLVLGLCVCPCPSPSPWPSELCLSLCYGWVCGRVPRLASWRALANCRGRRGCGAAGATGAFASSSAFSPAAGFAFAFECVRRAVGHVHMCPMERGCKRQRPGPRPDQEQSTRRGEKSFTWGERIPCSMKAAWWKRPRGPDGHQEEPEAASCPCHKEG